MNTPISLYESLLTAVPESNNPSACHNARTGKKPFFFFPIDELLINARSPLFQKVSNV